jgi:plasmid stabilization system protein ParE
MRASSGCLTPDAYPVDASSRRGLARHLGLSERTRTSFSTAPTVIEIRKSARSLKKFPTRGRKGREEGTRELLRRRLPHIIAYRVKGDAIEILHIWHPAQDR